MKHFKHVAVAAALGLCVGGPAMAAQTVSGNAFNPAVGLILNGHYAWYSQPGDPGPVSGILTGPESGRPRVGLSLDESELDISSNVDDQFYGFAAISFGEEGASVEEAFLQTLALPSGLTVKAGRFLSGIGYLNSHHAHTWEFIDAPLAYDTLMGGQYRDDGVQVTWLAPTDTYLVLGGEVMRGEGFPAGGSANNGTGARSVFADVSGDVGYSSSWQAGVSWLTTRALDRTGPDMQPLAAFTGKSDVGIAHFVWKWAPNGNYRERNFKFQTEYLRRHEDGQVFDGVISSDYTGTQSGWYMEGAYQWMPRWRFGLRYGQVDASNTVAAGAPAFLTPAGTPRRYSAMVDFANSEFSRIRLQFNRDESHAQGDNQVFLQYIMALGAHGAHQF